MTRKQIYERDNFSCQYCGCKVMPITSLNDYRGRKLPNNVATLDHIIPKSKGGIKSPENLVTCCYECNLLLQNKCYNNKGNVFQTFKTKRQYLRLEKGVKNNNLPTPEFIRNQRQVNIM